MLIFVPVYIVPKISDHSVINATKINAKENCENVNALSRKLHFCENCYIWGKSIADIAKIFPSIEYFHLLAHDGKIVQMSTWDEYYYIRFQ